MTHELVLADTSVWILTLRRKSPHQSIRKRMEQLLSEDRLAITPIVQVELLGGASTPINTLTS